MDKNPVKHCRELLGYSQEELSFQSGINRQVILRAEQGLYVTIPPRLIAYLSARTGNSNTDLSNDYSAWVDAKRRDAFGKLPSRLPEFTSNSPSTHPFIVWRESTELSRITFAKEFCIHLSTLTRFETDLRQATVPAQLLDALIASGYDLKVLNDLETRYSLYREWRLALQSNNIERIAKAHTANVLYSHTPVGNEKLSA